jgi:phosphate-selective porin OprO/OprP
MTRASRRGMLSRVRNELRYVLLLLTPALAPTLHAQATSPPPAPTAWTTGYEDAFFLRSADGRNEVKLGGLFQFGANHYDDDRSPDSEFDVRRMRLEVQLKLQKNLRANLEPNFLPEGVEMEEAWFGLDFGQGGGGESRLMLGRMKAPFGLEEVRSRRWIDFPRFSILNQFSPAEDHGIFVNSLQYDRRVEFGLAAYNGTGESEANSSKDLAARWMLHLGEPDEGPGQFQIGIASTYGAVDDGTEVATVTNEVRQDLVTFDPAAHHTDDRERLGLELAWFRGPWMVQAEWMRMEEELASGATETDATIQGWYATISRVLTGEKKSFGRTAPRTPFDFEHFTGRGAWIAAVRWSDLELDDDLGAAGFATPGTFTDRIQTLSVGINWVANEHVMIRNAWVHSFYDDEVQLDGGTVDSEDSFLVELQLAF